MRLSSGEEPSPQLRMHFFHAQELAHTVHVEDAGGLGRGGLVDGGLGGRGGDATDVEVGEAARGLDREDLDGRAVDGVCDGRGLTIANDFLAVDKEGRAVIDRPPACSPVRRA